MFVLNSDISIGAFHFSGVHSVRIRRSLYSYVDTATIVLPSLCNVTRKGKTMPSKLITGHQFNDGDPVVIKLGYGQAIQEFKGFVKRRNMNVPLEVECEGYSWKLRQNNVKGTWDSISVKELLTLACKNTGINLVVADDITLTNIEANDITGAQLIDLIKKSTDDNLVIFFIEPDKLWCGYVYTPVSENKDVFGIGSVSYRLGFNVIKDNDLQQRNFNDNPLQVNYIKKSKSGPVLNESSDTLSDKLKVYKKLLNKITTAPEMKLLAKEKQNSQNYIGYEGHINAFLEPHAYPGFVANITDTRYETQGNYLVEGIEIIFGTNGAKRIVEIGPALGFANSAS